MAEKGKKRARAGPERQPARGFVDSLTDLVEKLGELAQTGRELRQAGEISSPEEKLKAVYGLRVRMGLGGETLEVEPFGDLKFDQRTRHPVVQEVREPLVDVIAEADKIMVVAEMPGVTSEDVSLELNDDVMNLEARGRDGRKYRKEVLLPAPVKRENISISCNNGIVQIECRRD